MMIIEKFISNNKITTKVIPCKTIREKNGIAYSSNTLISYKTIKKTALLNIYIADKSKKE